MSERPMLESEEAINRVDRVSKADVSSQFLFNETKLERIRGIYGIEDD
jgi:hypothetical protein